VRTPINGAWHEQHPMPRQASLEERISWHLQHREHCRCRPIPDKLVAVIRARASGASGSRRPSGRLGSATESRMRSLLTGGDRRSVAQSEHVHELVRKDPRRVAEIALLAMDANWLVSMRAMDLLEKLAYEHPDWVQPHKELFIGPLADSDKWEIRLQVVRALPLLRWTPRERSRVLEILSRDLEHPQKFVRAWALDSLAILAQTHRAAAPLVERSLGFFEHSGSKALQARARLIRARMARGKRA
jgi:hypothetical protein